MTKKIRRTFLAGCSALLVLTASLTAFAACGGGKKAKLTLSAGEGGTLKKTEYSLKAGADLSAFLKDKAPAVTVEDITFAGWFNGADPIEGGATMPEEGLSLTAKYNTGYTLNVYTWDETASDYGKPATTSHTAFWHEPLNILDVYTMPKGYVLDNTQSNVTSTTSLEPGFAFNLYEKLGEIFFTFYPNAPSGVEIGGEMRTQTASFGQTFTVPACAFTAPEEYRFAGWSKTADGTIDYRAGDTFKAEQDVKLYAVWEPGMTDIFGGDDYLFHTAGEDAVYLHRAGLEEKKGSFDAATSVFTFGEGEKTVLQGKIVEGNYYYFRDLGSKTFQYSGDTKETLVFGEKDKVTYTVTPEGGQPAVTQGVYTVDPETGDYLFEGGETTFFFTLFLDPATDTYSFARTAEGVGAERGFYALYSENSKTDYDLSNALQLDGMYDGLGFASAGIYKLVNGRYERQMTTYYGLESVVVESEEDAGMSAAADSPVNYAILLAEDEYFLFRLEERAFTENGRKFKGVFRLEDGFRGKFGTYDEVMEEKTSLILDGFGGAEYTKDGTKASGTYTVETLKAHGATFEYIAFTPADGNKLYIQFYSMLGQPYYLASEVQPKIVEVSNSLFKVYGTYAGGYGGITLYEHGFLYFYDGETAAVYTYFTDAFDGETEYSVGVDYGAVAEKTDEKGVVFTFESIMLAEGETIFEFRYTQTKDAVETTVFLMETLEAGEGQNKISVDKWGTLSYGGKTYAYGTYTVNEIYDNDYDTGEGGGYVIREYTFGDTVALVRGDYFYDEGENTDPDDPNAWMDDTYGYKFETVLDAADLLEIVFKQYPGQNDYFDRIYFIEGLPQEGETKRAGILLVASDEDGNVTEEVLLHGDLSLGEDKTYTLSLDEPSDENLMDFYDTYDSLTFKIEKFEGRTAAIACDGYSSCNVTNEDGSKLEFDDYGVATYTPAEGKGEPFTGKADMLGGYYTNDYANGYTLVRIASEEGEEKLFLIETVSNDDGDETSFKEVAAEDAGVYTYMSGDSIMFDLYFVFFGSEEGGKGGVFADYTGAFLPEDDEDGIGWYVPTGETVTVSGESSFREYALYADKADLDAKEPIAYIAAADVQFSSSHGAGGTARVFIERVMPLGDYDVAEGGNVFGNGYEISKYTDAEGAVWYGEFGRENLKDDSPKQSEYTVEDGDHSKDGKQLFFYAYYILKDGKLWQLSDARHFLFDVIEDKESGEISLTLRDSLTGTFALFEKGAIEEETLLYFDGHGAATLKKGKTETKGTYTYDEEAQEGVFTPASGKGFGFAVFTMTKNGETWNIFSYTAEEHLYVNADWSVLSLYALGRFQTEDAIYSGVYTDTYGDSHYGIYEYLTDTLVSFETDNGVLYFNLLSEKTFELNDDEFVIDGGVLYGYQGPAKRDGLKIPDNITEIKSGVFAYMYLTGELDLNDVQIIGDRAFYETNITDSSISSDVVTYVGDEAFFNSAKTYFDGNLSTTTLANVSFPAAETIGVRAFYGCNQMAMLSGTIVLKDIRSIGVQAFYHNINSNSGTMKLDLTAVPDLSKVTIDKTAFEAGTGSMTPDDAPVVILISFAGLSQIGGWPENIQKWVQIGDLESDPGLEGQGFMSADGTAYYLFNAPEGGAPSVTEYSNESFSWTSEEAYLWSVEESDGQKNVRLYANEGGAWVKSEISFALNAATVELGNTTCYRTDTEHTLTVKEGEKQDEKTFVFNFEVEISEYMFGNIDLTVDVTSATYGGKEAGSPEWSGGTISLDYTEDNDTYQVLVDVAKKTSSKSLSARIVVTTDGTWRATFGSFTESGTPNYLNKLEKKNGDGYDVVMSSRTVGQGTFTYKATAKDAEKKTVTTTVYTVTYTGGFDNPQVTVSEQASTKYEVTAEASELNKYRATFLAATQDAAEMEELTKFEVYIEQGKYFEEVYGAYSFGVTVKKETEENTFTVTKEGYSETTVYTVKYAAQEKPHIEVTVSKQSVVKVETTHEAEADYYGVSILVDDTGKVLALKEVVKYTWDSTFNFYDNFTVMVPDTVTKTENEQKVTFTFTTLAGETYTIVIDTTNAAQKQYTATVTMQSI